MRTHDGDAFNGAEVRRNPAAMGYTIQVAERFVDLQASSSVVGIRNATRRRRRSAFASKVSRPPVASKLRRSIIAEPEAFIADQGRAAPSGREGSLDARRTLPYDRRSSDAAIIAIAELQSFRLTAFANARSFHSSLWWRLVATPSTILLEFVERFHRIPSRGMRCASTRPGSVGPIEDADSKKSSGDRSARDGDRA